MMQAICVFESGGDSLPAHCWVDLSSLCGIDLRPPHAGNLCSMGTLMQLLRSIVSPIWGWIMVWPLILRCLQDRGGS